MVVEGVERTASADVMDATCVDTGGAGAEEDGLISGAVTVADLACLGTRVLVLRGDVSSLSSSSSVVVVWGLGTPSTSCLS